MPLVLPTTPGPREAHVRPVTARADLNPAFGDGQQRLGRKGSRYALDVEMPSLSYVETLAWSDLDDETDTVVMEVPQPGLDTGEPGLPRVNGGGQAGRSLVIDGVTPGYVFRKGQYLSVKLAALGGTWFLYRARAAATANGAGQLIVPLRTMLRWPPTDNDVVEIARPVIEGFARHEGAPVQVTHEVEFGFTVEER